MGEENKPKIIKLPKRKKEKPDIFTMSLKAMSEHPAHCYTRGWHKPQ
jgi:hypothetical protein